MRLDALYRLKRYDQAIADGKQYVAQYPHVAFAYTVMADAANQIGQEELNRRYLVKAMQLDPEFWYSYRKLYRLDPAYVVMPDGWLPVAQIWQ